MLNLYDVFLPFTRLAFRLYYRDISISGLENVPTDKPVIIASNHPSAFIEPCILASLLPRRLYFMARGDIFVKPIFIKILGSLNILPIYRFRDGFGKLKKNDASFSEAFRILGERKAALHILVEGRTRQIKHLEPLQKGAARIAFGTMHLFPEQPIDILPVGITFGTPNKSRDCIMISVGKPIPADQYFPDNPDDERAALTALTKDLHTALKQELVHIDPASDEPVAEHFLTLDRSQRFRYWMPWARRSREALSSQQSVVQWWAGLPEMRREVEKEEVTAYFEKLDHHRVTDLAVASTDFLSVRSVGILVIFAPVFFASCLVNIWPILIADAITRKQVRQEEFIASVRLALYLVLFLIYIPILGMGSWLAAGSSGVLIAAGAILSGVPALAYRDLLFRALEVVRFLRLPRRVQLDLQQDRERIACNF